MPYEGRIALQETSASARRVLEGAGALMQKVLKVGEASSEGLYAVVV